MPRVPRVEFQGAQYHVMCRGDRREAVFHGEGDHDLFLKTLGQACKRTGWQVHAFVLMKNHYHLMLETPEGNLVSGMRWFQTTYTARFNARHRLCGHLFQGRYKALVVDPDEPEYARQVVDYIHLNPVRAGVVGQEAELSKLPWCSYRHYTAGSKGRPPWVRTETVYGEFGLDCERAGDRRRFRRYMSDLISRERDGAGSSTDEGATGNAVGKGWVLGGDEFRERMEKLVEAVVRGSKRKSFAGESLRKHDEESAKKLLERGLSGLGLEIGAVRAMRKNDPRKQALGWLLKSRTVVPNDWICECLGMGHWSNLSRAFRALERAEAKKLRQWKKKMLICTD